MSLTGKPRIAGQHLREHYPVTQSKLHGGEGYGNVLGGGILVRSYKAGATTYLYDEILRTYGNDFFNGMTITALKCTSITFGEQSLISDFDEDTAKLTFGAFSGAVAKDDWFVISLPEAPSGTFAGQKIANAITFAAGTTGAVATHEILTVSGLCEVVIVPECTVLLASGGAANIKLGHEDNTAAFVALTTGTDIDADEIWTGTSPAKAGKADNSYLHVISNGNDIGYEITAATITSGAITFHMWWRPLEPGASCASADGTGTL